MTKIQNNLIPYNKYFIDSGKFFIDADKFTEVKIPEHFTLIDSDTGEALDDFKKSILQITYLSHKIYIGTVKRTLKQGTIDKVLIYFPAKIAGSEYFHGIRKHHIIEVLEFLKQKGYLLYENVNDIYKNIFVKDLDLKKDYCLSESDRAEIRDHQKKSRENFNGIPEYFHLFDNKKQGLGICTYTRERATIAKPFIKFYDKSYELKTRKNDEFFKSLPVELQTEVNDNFIYRFEYTLKDKTFFNKFGISNRLEEVNEVLQEKWSEIGRKLLEMNFQPKVRKPKDMSKLGIKESVLCLCFLDDIQRGLSVYQIKQKYLVCAKTKMQKSRARVLFDKIYYNTGIEHNEEIQEEYFKLEKWDKLFGFI